MKAFIRHRIGVVLLACLSLSAANGQINIFDLMERRDLRIDQVEKLAKRYFDSVGTERGTGYKQYQRWIYESRFHLDANGFFLPPNYDWDAYQRAANNYDISSAISSSGGNLLAGETGGTWIEKGPFNWNRTSGWNPGVGRITSIAIHPADTTVIYITSPGGGVWKSTNSGASWFPLTDYNGSWMNMMSVAIDPTNPSTVYAGSNSNVIIKSTDGGITWRQVNFGQTGNIRKILIHPTNPNLVFVTAGNGLWRSTDGAATWTRVFTATMEDVEFHPTNASIMYASGSVFLRSTDGGITWTQFGATQGIPNTGRTLIAVTPARPDRVYVVQARGNEFGSFMVSDDAGASFTTTITGSSTSCTNFFGYETTGCGTGGQAGYDMAITVSPTDANEVHIGGIITWKSTNGGTSFTATSAWSYPNSIGYNHADVHVLEWCRNTIYTGTDGGIYKSTDKADNWIDLSKGLGIRQFYRIANSKTNSQLFSGGAQDNGSSIFKSDTWFDWLGADGMDGIISPTNENLIWGTSQYGSIYRSTNGGSSYSTLSKPSSGEWVTPLAYDESSGALYVGWNGVFRSMDNGTSWTNISGTAINTTLNCLVLAPSNPKVMYASKSTTLYISRDGGTTWTTSSAPAFINAIAVSPQDDSKVYLACNSTISRVMLSTDGGTTFTNISDNLPNIVARAITVDNNANETVYLGMNMGMFYRDNTTTGWVNITDNLPLVSINDVDIQKSGNLLRIGSYGRGVWERPLIGAAAVSCGVAQSLNTTNLSSTAVTLNWQAVSGATGYKVEYQSSANNTWIVAAASTNSTSVNLTGLTPGTLYNWRVSAICGTATGDFASSQFTTMLDCGTPGSPTTTNITEASAILNWTAVTAASTYTVEYKVNAATSWLVLSSSLTTTTANLTGLLSNTNYDWRVRANCTSGSSAYATAAFTTTTPVVCVDAFETNNTSKQSKSIPMGSPNKGGIDKSTDEDWFKFATGNTSFTNVRVSLTTLPDDYDLFLYDKNLRIIASSQNTGNIDEVLVYNSNATRTTYYVRVIGKNGRFNPNTCYSIMAETSNTPFAPVGRASNVGEDLAKNEAMVYPNPANSRFTLRFKSDVDEQATLKITNATGMAVQTRGIAVNKGLNQVEVTTNTLKPGTYMVQVQSNNLSIIKQVLIVR